MKSIVYCYDCNKYEYHYKKNEGAWFYQVCKECMTETLLINKTWKEFNNNRVDERKL